MRAQKGNLEKICHPGQVLGVIHSSRRSRRSSRSRRSHRQSHAACPSAVGGWDRGWDRASIGEPLCSNSISSACASFRATSRVSDIRLRHSLGDPQMARGTSLGQQLFVQPRLATRSLMATSIRRLSFAACLVHPGWWAVSARSVSPVIFARPDSISALLPRRREGPSGFSSP